jgi:T5SS/PEP-CTERM-associated repeat protein
MTMEDCIMRANGIAVRSIRLSLIHVSVLLTAVISGSAAQAAISQHGNNSANPTSNGADPIIGISDLGRMTIDLGSSVTSNVAILGDLATGIGLVTVKDFNGSTGATSTWTTNSLMVGDAGTGRLEVLNGAIVTVDFTTNPGAGDFVVGNLADSVGTVIVDGLGSMLRLGDDTVIGQAGTGTLRIANEGYVVGTNGATLDTDIFTIGVRGRVELAGGRLRTEVFANNGAIVGDGRLDNVGTISNTQYGHIDVNDGDRLEISAVLDNKGAIAVDGGEIEFFKAVTNTAATAEITLRDQGILRFIPVGFGFDSTNGVLATTAGTNDIYGTVRIQTANSKISVSGGSTAVFHDPVTNTGGTIEVFPGSSIVYLQGLTTTGSGSAMAVALADPESGSGGSPIEVSDSATLTGDLRISLASGFKPSAGDVFPIVTAAGGITGSLNLASAPILPGGMQWDLDVNPTNVLLTVVATGDYNGNGVVDAADYVVWRKSQNQTGSGLAADSNGDSVVNVTDYNFWRSRVGNIVGTGLGFGGAVPEPTCATLLIVTGFAAAWMWLHPRHRGLSSIVAAQ